MQEWGRWPRTCLSGSALRLLLQLHRLPPWSQQLYGAVVDTGRFLDQRGERRQRRLLAERDAVGLPAEGERYGALGTILRHSGAHSLSKRRGVLLEESLWQVLLLMQTDR